jgi:hypothetical protein
MTNREPVISVSLGSTLDRLLEEAAGQDLPSFRRMAKAAGLDPSRDFKGASLRNMDFRDEDLRGFDFSNADLAGADFRRANIDGVPFSGADLRGAIGIPGMSVVLPRVSANLFSGLIETLAAAPYGGKADLPALADELHMQIDDLSPVAKAMGMFGFATFGSTFGARDIKLTDIGLQFAELGTDDRKKLFRRQLLSCVPLAARIRHVLEETADHVVPRSQFLSELGEHMSPEDAEHTLRAVTAWGRFAEVFTYNDDHGTFALALASPDYKKYAYSCLEMADAAIDDRARAAFTQMAQVWFRLAEEKAATPENLLEALTTTSPDYRRYAQACLQMAESAADENTRAAFTQMAQGWFRLANVKGQ